MKFDLTGAYELHVHTAPDVGPRKFSDEELVRRLLDKGYAGVTIKGHFNDTAARAAVLREKFPDFTINGGLVLNKHVGGFNPYAVEACGNFGGRFLWMPTMDSYSYKKYNASLHESNKMVDEVPNLLYLLDEKGKLKRELYDILDIAADKKMIVATGHVSPREGLELLKVAKDRNVEKFVITHADNPANRYSKEELKLAVSLGAIVEFCYFTVYYGKTSIEEMAEFIKVVGVNSAFISTDFGQVKSPYPDEGMEMFANLLLEKGFTEEDITNLVKNNPKNLLA